MQVPHKTAAIAQILYDAGAQLGRSTADVLERVADLAYDAGHAAAAADLKAERARFRHSLEVQLNELAKLRADMAALTRR